MIPDGHILIFVRHGKRLRNKADGDPHLTEPGVAMSRRAAEWLQAQGIVPTQLLATPWHRTRETAAEFQCVYAPNSPPIARISGGPRDRAGWEALAETHPSGTAIVAHHTTQQLLEREFDLTPTPRDQNAMIYVMNRSGDTWQCIARHPGEA